MYKIQQVKDYSIEVKWASIFAIMMLVWMYIEKLMGLHDKHIDRQSFFTNFIILPAMLIYVLALLDKRERFYNGRMTYIQGFKSGAAITVMVAIFSPMVEYITFTITSPEYFPNAINYTVSNGWLTKEIAEASFNLGAFQMDAAINILLTGLLASTVISLFTRKRSLNQIQRVQVQY